MSETANTQPSIHDVQQARVALEAGATIHTLDPDLKPRITDMLAGEYRIYTTSVDQPRKAESYGAFVMGVETRQAEDLMGDRAKNHMRQVPGYEMAVITGYLATRLAQALGTVTGMGRAEGVRAADPTRAESTIGARRIPLSVPNEDDGLLVHGAFQGLLRSTERVYPSYPHSSADGTPTVSVFNLTEYPVREFGSTCDALMAEEDRVKRQTILPPDKVSYAELRRRGETFRPVVDDRLANADASYQRLKASLTANGAEYPGYPALQPDVDNHLLSTDIAPMLQAMRNILNALIKKRRIGMPNLPQNPNTEDRLHSHARIDFTRDRQAPEAAKLGPSRDRTRSPIERLIAKGKLTAEQTKNRPGLALLRLAGKVTMGLQDVLLTVAEHMPSLTTFAKQHVENARAWRRHKQEVVAARARVQDALQDKIVRLILEEDRAAQQQSRQQ